jgi:hypothetical protein
MIWHAFRGDKLMPLVFLCCFIGDRLLKEQPEGC